MKEDGIIYSPVNHPQEEIMGTTYRKGRKGGTIEDFWPDDTDDVFFLPSDENHSMGDIFRKAREKWPNIRMDELNICGEHIHTRCLTYDLHDPTDYTTFVVVKAGQEYFDRTKKETKAVVTA